MILEIWALKLKIKPKSIFCANDLTAFYVGAAESCVRMVCDPDIVASEKGDCKQFFFESQLDKEFFRFGDGFLKRSKHLIRKTSNRFHSLFLSWFIFFAEICSNFDHRYFLSKLFSNEKRMWFLYSKNGICFQKDMKIEFFCVNFNDRKKLFWQNVFIRVTIFSTIDRKQFEKMISRPISFFNNFSGN